MGINYFDSIFYINLEHRKDRKQKLLRQLEKLDVKKEKIIRIPAVLDPLNGARGCALSHIKALDLAIEKKLKNVLILEDDCEFVQTKTSINKLIKYFFDIVHSWDVLYLGDYLLKYEQTQYPKIKRVIKALRTHAYAVNQDYMENLKKCFNEAYDILKNQASFSESFFFAIDRYWSKLQAKDKWYKLDITLIKQSRSYSDIENIEKERLIFNM